jgi:hypothetical protein
MYVFFTHLSNIHRILYVATVASLFDPPEGKDPYSYIFDFSGEMRHDRTEMVCINAVLRICSRLLTLQQIHITSTFNVSRLIGLEAAKRKVKVYVRAQPSFYTSPDKGSHDEKEDVKPVGAIGIWWHETLRALAAIEE